MLSRTGEKCTGRMSDNHDRNNSYLLRILSTAGIDLPRHAVLDRSLPPDKIVFEEQVRSSVMILTEILRILCRMTVLWLMELSSTNLLWRSL